MTLKNTDALDWLREGLPHERTAVLVCDVQNDFCLPGGKIYDRAAKGSATIAQFLETVGALTAAARLAGVRVIYARNTHLAGAADISDEHFGRMRSAGLGQNAEDVAVIAGSWGHQIVDAVAPQEGDIVVDKSGFDIFRYSMLNKVARARGLDAFVLTGLSTYAGILATYYALMDLGYHFAVPKECVAGYDAGLHAAALRVMGTHAVDMATLLAIWSAAR
jgi:ureidoacrylate peracid hydrolase